MITCKHCGYVLHTASQMRSPRSMFGTKYGGKLTAHPPIINNTPKNNQEEKYTLCEEHYLMGLDALLIYDGLS